MQYFLFLRRARIPRALQVLLLSPTYESKVRLVRGSLVVSFKHLVKGSCILTNSKDNSDLDTLHIKSAKAVRLSIEQCYLLICNYWL